MKQGSSVRKWRLLVPWACTALAACDVPTAIEQLVRVTISTSADSMRRGGFVRVRVVARNVGLQAIDVLKQPGAYCFLAPFTVEDAAGTVVGPKSPPNLACDLVGYMPQPLEPGDSVVLESEWPQGDSRGDHAWETASMAPGKYFFRGYIRGRTGNVRSGRVALTLLP